VRGRPRKPTAQLDELGAFDHDPKRAEARKNEPKPNGPVGDPPDYFTPEQRAIWFELIDLTAPGVLAKSDRITVELASRLTHKMRVVPGRMQRWLKRLGFVLADMDMDPLDVAALQEDISAAIGCTSQELSLLATTLTRMGMTPADRSRVQSESPDPAEREDPLSKLDAILNGGTSQKSVQ
jgi:hypothetical protein